MFQDKNNVKKDIIIIGDTHGYFHFLNVLINRRLPKIVFQCGDFGFWPKFPSIKVKNGKTDVFLCDGNHEDHESLLKLENNEIFPNVFYMKRGSYLTLEDGRNVLFMGGALSVDKDYRTPGLDWFPEETISQKDIENLPDINIDIIISHTAPQEFEIKNMEVIGYMKDKKINDPSRIALSYVYEKYKPKLWYFGHFHRFNTGVYENCKWTCLPDCRHGDCWMYLEN